MRDVSLRFAAAAKPFYDRLGHDIWFDDGFRVPTEAELAVKADALIDRLIRTYDETRGEINNSATAGIAAELTWEGGEPHVMLYYKRYGAGGGV